MRVLATVLCLLAGAALADPQFPALYDVTAVAADDRLNLRAAPSADAARVGDLAADAVGVEAVEIDDTGRWLLIGQGEISGWAAARYLRPHPVDPTLHLTRRLSCGGTEPFWDLAATQGDTARLTQFGGPEQTLPAAALRPSANRTDRFFLNLGLRHAAIISVQSCSDGMSDRVYGLEINLVIDNVDVLSGCCSLLP